MLEVWSAEYSAVASPSRLPEAPEKKSTLSMVPGTSNSRASRMGLPACLLSSCAISSARAASSRVKRPSTPERSPGVARDDPGYALFAVCTASSTSSGPAIVIAATRVLLEGSMTSAAVALELSRRRPFANWLTAALTHR